MVTKVTVDVTPPSAGKVYVGNVISTKYVTTDVITIHWQGFRDEESNIKEFECAVMSENGEIVVDFQPASGSSITLQKNNKFTKSFIQGHIQGNFIFNKSSASIHV